MKKQIAIEIGIIACAALYAAVWPRSAKDGKVPAEPLKPAVNAEVEPVKPKPRIIAVPESTPEPEHNKINGLEEFFCETSSGMSDRLPLFQMHYCASGQPSTGAACGGIVCKARQNKAARIAQAGQKRWPALPVNRSLRQL